MLSWLSACRLSAYGPANATAIPKPHNFLPYWISEWFYLFGTSLPGCPGKRLCHWIGAFVVCQVELLMVQRDELVCHSHELESTIAQLKAKDGQLYNCYIHAYLHTGLVMSGSSQGWMHTKIYTFVYLQRSIKLSCWKCLMQMGKWILNNLLVQFVHCLFVIWDSSHYTVSQKKQDTKLLPTTSPNINQF